MTCSGSPPIRPTARDLSHVMVLTTGGTIAGAPASRSRGGYDAGAIEAETLLAQVPGISRHARLSAEQVCAIGSQDMNDAIWLRLAHRVAALTRQPDVDAILITHGTDTMEETALFLDLVTDSHKPVVLVGAMRPPAAADADGRRNLLEAVRVATAPGAGGRGVLVVLNGLIHEARDVTKANTVSLHALQSPHLGPAGDASGEEITFFSPRPPRQHYPLPAAAPLPGVEIIYAYAGVGAAPVEAAIAAGARGIVLAGVGGGNAAKATIDALHRAVRAGVAVVRASRTGSGPVLRNIELDDDALGFVAGGLLPPAKARVLLQILIASGICEPERMQAAFHASGSRQADAT